MQEYSRVEQILDVAEALVRTRGYNSISYADIAPVIGVSKASLHHHFPTKSDLGLRLINRFTKNIENALAEIDVRHSSHLIRLREYARLYEMSFDENKMCLCGMLAAEHETLSIEMQEAINRFFESHEDWLEGLLLSGEHNGEVEFRGGASTNARLIVSNLQGALLVAKSLRSTERISSVASHLVEAYRSKRGNDIVGRDKA